MKILGEKKKKKAPDSDSQIRAGNSENDRSFILNAIDGAQWVESQQSESHYHFNNPPNVEGSTSRDNY